MSFCPNKSSKEYKALVSQFGENGAYSAWYQANKELLTEENAVNNEPIIPSIGQANTLLAGRMFNIQDKEFNSYEKELVDIEKRFPSFYGQDADVLRKIVKAINSTYRYIKASIVTGAQLDIKLEQVQRGDMINEELLAKLQKLFTKTGIKYISSSTALEMVGEIASRTPSFIQNGVVYVIEDRITDETLIEEFLHPFIQYIFTNNKELFDNLYQDAIDDKDLVKRIVTNYSNFSVADRKKEMVTQKLAELLNKNYLTEEPNTIPGMKVQLSKLFKELIRFFSTWLGGNMLEVDSLPSNMDLGQLANLLNTTGLELPVEYLAAPTFHLMDDINNQSKDNGYRVVGDSYEDKAGVKYSRLTEWVRNTISPSGGKSAEDWAKFSATKIFNKEKSEEINGVVKIKLPDGAYISLEELTEKILKDFNTSKAYGTIAHLYMEMGINKLMGKETEDLQAKIDKLAEGSDTQNPIDTYRMEWISNNMETILNLAGLNIADDRFSANEKDKILAELPYVLEQLGIGTTMDGLIFHSDGSMSIKDWKTGNLLSDEFSSELLGEFGSQIEDIFDNKIDRAKLEVVLRAIMIKYKNPTATFRQLSIEHLNKNTLVDTHNIRMDAYLGLLADHFKKNNPAIFEDLNSKGLFNPDSYNISIKEDLSKVFQSKEDTIEDLDKQILILKNRITQEKRSDKRNLLKYQLRELSDKRLAADNITGGTLDSTKGEISFFKSIFGKLSNVSNDLTTIFKTILDKAKMAFNVEYQAIVREHDEIMQDLLKEHGANYKNTGLKYTNKQGTGLFDFMWIERDKGNAKGYYGVTKEDDKYKYDLTPTQKRYVDFYREKLNSLYSEVADEVVSTDHFDQKVTNAQFNKQPTKLPDDFMPRVYLDFGEYVDRKGVGGSLAAWRYAQFKNKFIKSQFYASNATEAIPFKHMESDAIVGNQMHTFNAEIAFKQFAQNLLKKKHLDKVQALGNGLSSSLLEGGLTRTSKWLDDRLLSDVVGVKGKLPLSKKSFSLVKGGRKYNVDIDTLIDTAKAFVTAGTMWLKPAAGLRNGAYTIMMNHKQANIGSIARLFGIPPEDLNFTKEDMLKADKLWFQSRVDIAAGKGDQNKLIALLKQYNYLPDSYDYKVHTTSILSKKNKLLNSDSLYIFHSAFEDWGTGTIFASLLLHNKNQKTGKSLLDSYEFNAKGELKWEGGIRGKRADGSLIEGITYEELNKFKEVSAKIHGNYREDEKATIELYALGRLAMQFKRFVPQQLINIGQSRQLSNASGKFVELIDPLTGKQAIDKDGVSIYSWKPEVVEGKFRLLYGQLATVIGLGTNDYKWSKLSSRQKQDAISAWYTIGMFTIASILGSLAFDDDDEDKWLAVSYYKIIKDLSEGMWPLDMLENFQYQSVAGYKVYKLSKAFGEFFTSVATGKKNKYGKYKSGNELAKAIPPFSTIYDIDKAFNRTQKGENIGFDIGRVKDLASELKGNDFTVGVDWSEGK